MKTVLLPKLDEIAAKINTHLKRFEADKKINRTDPTYKTRPYYWAGSSSTGRRVRVCYVSYQGGTNLTRDEALAYLAWLDAGNVGTHYKQQRGE